MPELPEVQALAERLGEALVGGRLSAWEAMGFSGLKTVDPGPDDLLGAELVAVGRRGKFLVMNFDNGLRLLIHLSQAGRVDIEEPPKSTKPRGSVCRLVFDASRAILVREHGHERKAGWWVLDAGEEGPLAALGPEVIEEGFAEAIRSGDSGRHLHTVLRDQRFAAGVGRGYADDALHRARLSPFVSLRSLSGEERERLIEAIEEVLAEALERERQRTGGLSAARLGDRFEIHRRYGQPCPRCGRSLERVSYASYEIVYCPTCQTDGRVYADRRLSKLLR